MSTLFAPGQQPHRIVSRSSIQQFTPADDDFYDIAKSVDQPHFQRTHYQTPGHQSQSLRVLNHGSTVDLPFILPSQKKLSAGFSVDLLEFKSSRANLAFNFWVRDLTFLQAEVQRAIPLQVRVSYSLTTSPPNEIVTVLPFAEWNFHLPVVDNPTDHTYSYRVGDHITDLLYFLPNLNEKWFHMWLTVENHNASSGPDVNFHYVDMYSSIDMVSENYTPDTPSQIAGS